MAATLAVSALTLFTWLFVGVGTIIVTSASRNSTAPTAGVVTATAIGVATVLVCLGFTTWSLYLFLLYLQGDECKPREQVPAKVVPTLRASFVYALLLDAVPVLATSWIGKQHLLSSALIILLTFFACMFAAMICRATSLYNEKREGP